MKEILIYFSIKYKGYFHDIYNAIKKKEIVPYEELEEIQRKIESNEIKAISIVDDDYPESLKFINNPPFVIFYEGNLELLKRKKIMLTGDFSNQNIDKFINDSVEEISKNHVLISNLTKGLDEKIFDLFLKRKKDIILISPNGLLNPYFFYENLNNLDNLDNILLLSEFPNNSIINKRRLIMRNRLAIGLSLSLIIASSYKNSKIQSLVNFALEQGKDIYCFPGTQSLEDGNNLLISEGAKMITSIQDNSN